MISPAVSRYIVDQKCIGYATIRCISPPQPAGIASFDIHLGADLSSNAVSFSFEVPPEVTLISPPSGPTAGATVVTLSGRHMLGHHMPLCRFGSNAPSAADFVSSALMRCEAGSHEEGEVVAEVSVNDEGQHFTSSGISFEYYVEPR